MKIKNLVPRVHGFGRTIQLKPGETKSLTEEQVEQLRRDPTIRSLIIDRAVAVQPADLFDLEEDPYSLDPVAVPPRRVGGFLDHKIQQDRAKEAKKRAAGVKQLSDGSDKAWSNELQHFDTGADEERKQAPPKVLKQTAPGQAPKVHNALDRTKTAPVAPKVSPVPPNQQRQVATQEQGLQESKTEVVTEVKFSELSHDQQVERINVEGNVQTLLAWFNESTDNDLKNLINARGNAVAKVGPSGNTQPNT